MNNPIVSVLLNLLMNPIVIGGIVLLIVFLVKSGKSKSNPSDAGGGEDAASDANTDTASPSATASASTSTTSYGGTAKIFVNGGAPASGDKMGTLSVDGNRLLLMHSSAPLEISIATGRRHIVIEGGTYGDARVDRVIEFGNSDVLTVDMPGDGDDDLIRFQMIGYSEYRKAINDCGFRVTRRSL